MIADVLVAHPVERYSESLSSSLKGHDDLVSLAPFFRSFNSQIGRESQSLVFDNPEEGICCSFCTVVIQSNQLRSQFLKRKDRGSNHVA